jgi:hypothetical protein
MMFPNGMSDSERRFHALMVARDVHADGGKSETVLKAAQMFDAFLAGTQTQAQAEPVNTVVRLKLPGQPQ